MRFSTNEIGVTIAIPFFNAQDFLLDAIKSVMIQTHTRWELLLIDDGSTDCSLNIARSIDDPRVKVFSDGKNKRLASRLNEVVELASYDYIARMDADDIMSPVRIEKQLEILIRSDNFDLISTGMYSISDHNYLRGYRGKSFNSVSVQELVNKKKGILHASVLAKKDWYIRNRYNESLSLGQDVELWLRAASNNDLKVKSIADALYLYREEGNISKKKLLKAYRLEKDVLSLYINSYPFRFYYISKSFIKGFVVRVLSAFGLLPVLLKLRNNSEVTIDMENEFKSIVQSIASYHLSQKDQ